MTWSPIKLRRRGEIAFIGEAEGVGGGSQPVLVAHKQLLDADIKALPSDGTNLPIIVSPVPDAGTIIIPTQVVVVGPSVAYTHINGDAFVFLATSGGNSSNRVAWVEAAGGQITQLIGQSGSRSVATGYVSQPVTGGVATGQGDGADQNLYDGLAWQIAAYNSGDGDFQGGDPANKLDIYFYYVVVPTT